MRKIRRTRIFDDETYTFKIRVIVKNSDDDSVEMIKIDPTPVVRSKYTDQQLREIKECNQALTSRGMPEMFEEEIEYLLWPARVDPPSLDELQKLSGFVVQKTITYI